MGRYVVTLRYGTNFKGFLRRGVPQLRSWCYWQPGGAEALQQFRSSARGVSLDVDENTDIHAWLQVVRRVTLYEIS